MYSKKNGSSINIILFKEIEKKLVEERIILKIKRKNLFHVMCFVCFANGKICIFDRGEFTEDSYNLKIYNLNGDFEKELNFTYGKKKTEKELKSGLAMFKNVSKYSNIKVDESDRSWAKKYVTGLCSLKSKIVFAEFSTENQNKITYLHLINVKTNKQEIIKVNNKFVPEVLTKDKIFGSYQNDEDNLLSFVKLN